MTFLKIFNKINSKRIKNGFAFLLTCGTVATANANPIIDNVASGQAQVTQTAHTTTINQSSQQAIINWQKFDIGANETTAFVQPKGGVTLNRINPSQGASQIFGRLTATGQVILVNQAGIYFGPNAVVDVGGLIASTSDISDRNFRNKNYNFDKPSAYSGSIVNEGKIIAQNHGLVALLGTAVQNNGEIRAHLGSVVLASGSKFTLDMAGDGLVNLVVSAPATTQGKDRKGKPLSSAVSNSGSIIADGGEVIISARTAQGVLDNAINMSGVIQAKSVEQKNGTIVLSGGEYGSVNISGKISGGSLDVNTGCNGKGTCANNNTIYLGSKNIATSGDQNYNSYVLLQGATTLYGNNISFNNTKHAIDSTYPNSFPLTINANGTTKFVGDVGYYNGLGSLYINSAKTIFSANGTQSNYVVLTNGDQVYNSPITLGGDIYFEGEGSTITFNDTIDGAYHMVAAGEGVTFNGNVGSNAELLSLNVQAPTTLNGVSIKTFFDQTYEQAVTLSGTNNLTSTLGGDINFQDTVDGAATLNLKTNGVGTIIFSGDVGDTTALSSLTTSGGEGTIVYGDITADKQTYNNLLQLDSDGSLQTLATAHNGGSIAINAGLLAHNVTLQGTGTTQFTLKGDLGATDHAINNLNVVGGGNSTLNLNANDKTQTWLIDGKNTGKIFLSGENSAVSHFDFQGVSNLVSGSKNSTFKFTNNGFTSSVTGSGNGINAINFSGSPMTLAFNSQNSGTALKNSGATITAFYNMNRSEGAGLSTIKLPIGFKNTLTINADGTGSFNAPFSITGGYNTFYGNSIDNLVFNGFAPTLTRMSASEFSANPVNASTYYFIDFPFPTPRPPEPTPPGPTPPGPTPPGPTPPGPTPPGPTPPGPTPPGPTPPAPTPTPTPGKIVGPGVIPIVPNVERSVPSATPGKLYEVVEDNAKANTIKVGISCWVANHILVFYTGEKETCEVTPPHAG